MTDLPRAAPADWYRVRPLSDGVTWIDEPHIREFYRCNMWHVRGRDRDMLVDSGMGVVPLRRWVPLVAERALDAVASHTHFDHVGAHHEFDCRLCHAAEADILANPTRDNTLAKDYLADEIFNALLPAPSASTGYVLRAAPATRILQDGDVIDLGDRLFEVIHTPGGIALWEVASGILFSADIVYDGPLIEGESPQEQADHAASMKRLRHLPLGVVHGGHFPSYSGARHRALIEAWLRTCDERG